MAHYYFENTPHGMTRSGRKINTAMHYAYICRSDKYAHLLSDQREQLLYTESGNIPKWAQNAGDFWQEAENHRSKNGRAYREFRFALQEELPLGENLELVHKLMQEAKISDSHAYSLAIHDKPASFGQPHRNIHCHLMFNEKIQEKNRPLSSDKYFKNYAENKDGQPTQGYKASMYFKQKSTTYELRKVWADIVNAKFEEKNLSCRISEKTLKKQRLEKLQEGKIEEAELLDRVPAPHLGGVYKNPSKIRKISDYIDSLDRATEEDVQPLKEEKITEASKGEQKAIIFAHDFLLRKIANEIRSERIKARQQGQSEKDAEEAALVDSEDVVVTKGDLCEYAAEKQLELDRIAAKNMREYELCRKKIMDEKKIELAAKQRICPDYLKTIKKYSAAKKQMATLQEKMQSLYGKASAAEIIETTKKITDTKNSILFLGKEINKNKLLLEKKEKQLEELRAKLKIESDDAAKKAKKSYGIYKAAERKSRHYKELASEMRSEKGEVIYQRFNQKEVNLQTRINGDSKVGTCDMRAYKNDAYAIFRHQKDNRAKAVRIGDPINKGKIPVYDVVIDEKNGNVQAVAKSNEQTTTYEQKGVSGCRAQDKAKKAAIQAALLPLLRNKEARYRNNDSDNEETIDEQMQRKARTHTI